MCANSFNFQNPIYTQVLKQQSASKSSSEQIKKVQFSSGTKLAQKTIQTNKFNYDTQSSFASKDDNGRGS